MQPTSISLEEGRPGLPELSSVSAAARTPEVLAGRVARRRPTCIAIGISFLIDTFVLLLYHLAGTTPITAALFYLACGIVVTITALILSETNFADRFVDHYLIVPTCIASAPVQLVAIYLAPEVGFYLICTNFIVLGIGSLRMTAKQTVIVWIYVSVGLAILFLISDRLSPCRRGRSVR